MHEKKICFITCVNDERMYKECIFYIEHLNIPPGFSIESICMKNARSMTSAYNKMMKETDAKYKVYLHQDTLIKNKNFIYDVIKIFETDKNIGMIGMTGTKKIPINGVWWQSGINQVTQLCDNYDGIMKNTFLYEGKGMYEQVEVIDGLMMITQYDIKWREDIFDGWHFYDVSQSMEFNRNKYKIVIPKQENPWCVHDCGIVNMSNGYEEYRLKFIEEYKDDIYYNLPLVSVLIPTYNETHFFKQALESAINQTYKKIEIIIGDDSTTVEVRHLVEKYLNKCDNITFINNNGPLGEKGKNNMENLFKLSNGEYISYLMHDDLYNPDRIEKMMTYFQNDKSIALVTSSRNYIDEDNNLIDVLSLNADKNLKIKGKDAIKYIACALYNFIGEPTTAIFKKNLINNDEIMDLNGNQITCLGDISIWVKVLLQGDMIFLHESLSSFRSHKNQNTHNQIIQSGSVLDWYYLVDHCCKNNILEKNKEEFKKVIRLLYDRFDKQLKDIYNYIPNSDEKEEFNRVKNNVDKFLDNDYLYKKYI
ncbi:glycosyltransferase [Clostridioides sp. ES-S-0145-01]|uniref:glycosyltransferase n=1 Tax=Clostridioides sp. ES-S-0145-01 TaxID=2770784 RepID=UPI001D129C5B|nr:glycosyltransferase [Clostridioides sp. ES-S-0145-01]